MALLLCDCDDNYCVTSSQATHKARKDHKCCECRRVIKAGETYEYVSGIWSDSGFDQFKTCEHCVATKAAYERWADDACICFMDLGEHLSNSRRNMPRRLHRMARGYNLKWTHKRGPRKGLLMPVPTVPEKAKS